jgi:Protein of unknown function (DUF2442)
MLPRIVDARHAGGFRVWLRFADGLSGEVDITDQLFGIVFEPLKNLDVFAQVRVDPETDTITWPNGADFSPTWLRQQLLANQRNTAAAE